MEIKETKCDNCGKDIYVQKDHSRKMMFCTIGCMEEFVSKIGMKKIGMKKVGMKKVGMKNS
jgi:hypothetical protein